MKFPLLIDSKTLVEGDEKWGNILNILVILILLCLMLYSSVVMFLRTKHNFIELTIGFLWLVYITMTLFPILTMKKRLLEAQKSSKKLPMKN
jgi:membrane protein YdbS with pleckstrin-like domain